ncbi:MAG: cation-translocating P-type ATPase [Synergistales bacterium]
MPVPENPHSQTVDLLLQSLSSSRHSGLSSEAALDRLEEFGPNSLEQGNATPWWSFLISQFKSPMVWLLFLAALVSLFMKEFLDSAAILVVISLNAVIGFLTEYRAEKAMEALRSMTSPNARVLRDGRPFVIPADRVVPGDILLLEAGDLVPADARLVEVRSLALDEASLTGESMPVEKNPALLTEETPLADRTNCVFSGTAVVRGNAKALVYATGLKSELGRISTLLGSVRKQSTPLEERLEKFSRFLIFLVGGISALVFAIGVLQGRGIFRMFETGIALAVAAVPEGLPFVATMTLALGVHRMARQNALVRNLPSVETLGSTTVICTDKTGTLTLNDMTVRLVLPASPELENLLLRTAVLCNNASIEEGNSIGDPMEVALLKTAQEKGVDLAETRKDFPRTGEIPFDSRTMTMETSHGTSTALKGAPEKLLSSLERTWTTEGVRPFSEHERIFWLQKVAEIAAEGMRSLAFAWGNERDGLAFIGLMGIIDPPRPDVKAAVQACHEAGIHVVMVTGDHLETARSIAREVGILDGRFPESLDGKTLEEMDEQKLSSKSAGVSVIARVAPEHKLKLVRAFQASGETVAMTGDGVNDAVALKQADVGIAMGIQGTEVSKESSDIILQDDRFSTIVKAIGEGRRIFGNIRKSVLFLLCCNLSEVFTLLFALLFRLPAILLPLQILWINLITDVLPALALSLDPPEPGTMRRPPMPRTENILTPRHHRLIFSYGSIMTLGVFAVLFTALSINPYDLENATAMGFHAMVIAQLFFVFNVREHSLFRKPRQLTANPWLILAVLLSMGTQFFITHIPVFQRILSIHPLPLSEWGIVLVGALLPTAVAQVHKILLGR